MSKNKIPLTTLLAQRKPIEDFEFERELTLGNLLLYKNRKKIRTYNSVTGELTQEYIQKHNSKFHNPLEVPPNLRCEQGKCNKKNSYHDTTSI